MKSADKKRYIRMDVLFHETFEEATERITGLFAPKAAERQFKKRKSGRNAFLHKGGFCLLKHKFKVFIVLLAEELHQLVTNLHK
ncbi:MAG: hypothetical protein QM664_04130 [Flavihumibacter sp.]